MIKNILILIVCVYAMAANAQREIKDAELIVGRGTTDVTFTANVGEGVNNPFIKYLIADDKWVYFDGTETHSFASKELLDNALSLKADKLEVSSALLLKADLQYVNDELLLKADLGYVNTELALKADIASPILTGDPQAPNQGSADNDTSIANTAFVQTAITNLNNALEPRVEDVEIRMTDAEDRLDAIESDGSLTAHINDTATHGVTGHIVGTQNVQTLTNKTINADDNTLTNLKPADFKAGTIKTDLTTPETDHLTLPSALAVQNHVDAVADTKVSLTGNESVAGTKTFTDGISTDKLTVSTQSNPCPSYSATAMLAISSPSSGDCVFNTTAGELNVFDGTRWNSAGSGGAGGGGGSGNIAFFSSAKLTASDWQMSPVDSVLSLDETAKLIGKNSMKWSVPSAGSTRTLALRTPRVMLGDAFRSPNANRPLMLDISFFLRTYTLPSTGLFKVLVKGYQTGDLQIFSEEIYSASMANSANKNVPFTLTFPFTMFQGALNHLRLELYFQQSADAVEIYLDNVAFNVRAIQNQDMFQYASGFAGSTNVWPYTNVVVVTPDPSAVGNFLVIPPLDKHSFTVRFIPGTNENVQVTVQGAEDESMFLYTNESKRYFFDQNEMLWRAY